MFDALKNMLRRRRDAEPAPAFADDDKRVAEAALMFHVIAADGIVTDEEKRTLSQRVSRHFGLTDEEAAQLVQAAREADAEAIDLYRFTSTLKRELDYQQRLGLIEGLWEMVFADGVVHELEDNVVWRVAELLDVETRDRMELKQRVREGHDRDEAARG
ncbi:MAG: hypothetical protein BroJett030_25580 [Alphaproteobacteria bacterium]|nr:MAG: hypothetical protein BroJett030_25580 [Alphaproteobacteria bacterium]